MTLTYGKTEDFCPDCNSVQMARVLELKGWSAAKLRCLVCQTEWDPRTEGPDQGKVHDHDLDHTPGEITESDGLPSGS